MPLVIDLYCGLGGWTEGFLAEGYRARGYDIEEHVYGEERYPGELVVRDVLQMHGSEIADADVIVGSSPCQEYSYMAMPWSLAKAKADAIRADETGELLRKLNALFEAQFRIQREACEAAGRHIPMVVENVRGAQPWVGPAAWNFGSYYLWGDVPALMPAPVDARKVAGFRFDGAGGSFQTASVEKMVHRLDGAPHTKRLTNPAEHVADGFKVPGIKLSEVGFNVAAARAIAPSLVGTKYVRTEDDKRQHIGLSRKAASAKIAKIPFALSSHIARVYKPRRKP